MTPEQKKIYFAAYHAAIEALESTVAYREHRTAGAKRRADAASAAAGQAAGAASKAKSELEYGAAYERLEEAACCAELVWRALTTKHCTRMNRHDFKQWADRIRSNLAADESSQINEGKNKSRAGTHTA